MQNQSLKAENCIEATFGKKGSGKTVLLFNQMARKGGRIIYFSPVMPPPFDYREIWHLSDIGPSMKDQRPGEVLYIVNVSLAAFDLVCCYSVMYRDFSIFLDEANHYTGSKELSDLIDYGRHNRTSVYGNTRRYTDIPRKITANADFINIFKTNEPRDLDYLKQYCGRDIIDHVPELPEYHYIRYNTTTHFFETICEKPLTN